MKERVWNFKKPWGAGKKKNIKERKRETKITMWINKTHRVGRDGMRQGKRKSDRSKGKQNGEGMNEIWR